MASAILAVTGMLVASPAAWAVLVKAADWQMNETSGQMIDSSGKNNHGTPTDVVQGFQEDGKSTYVFNGSTSRVPVPDTNDSLDPFAKDITLSAVVKVTDKPMEDDSYDVVRKGLSSPTAGDYKMEVFRTADPTVGRLHCLFKGDGGRLSRKASRDIVDGNWYKLECIKTSDSVKAQVTRLSDGRVWSATQTGSTGSISNAKEVLVGAKKTNPFDDMFDGSMDFVSIAIDQ